MKLPESCTTVTPVSKTLALILFISFPFIGFYLGRQYQQLLTPKSTEITFNNNRPSTLTPIPSVFPTLSAETERNFKLCPDASYVKIDPSGNQTPDCRWGFDGLGIKEGDGLYQSPKYQVDTKEVVKGTLDIFRSDEKNVKIQLSAKSTQGKITEIEIWSDLKPNTIWQPFNEFVSIPKEYVDQFVYAKFKDDKGNISYTYYGSIFPYGIPAQ